MSYASLMVYLGIGDATDARLAIAADLAKRFNSRLIGICAADPLPPMYVGEAIPAEVIDEDHKAVEQAMADAKKRFQSATEPLGLSTEWRQALQNPLAAVSRNARAADLIVVGTERDGGALDGARLLDPSDLLMEVGRPVLVVPPEARGPEASSILVAWKDTPEARRAARDALPLLKMARKVIVCEIDDANRLDAAEIRIADVVGWLDRHGIAASGTTSSPAGNAASQIDAVAREVGADLVVAGAYGHTRFREWILGGVTRDRIRRSPLCSLMAH